MFEAKYFLYCYFFSHDILHDIRRVKFKKYFTHMWDLAHILLLQYNKQIKLKKIKFCIKNL